MKITVFDLYVCGLLLRVFSGRAPSADCAVCGAGVRGGAGRGAGRSGRTIRRTCYMWPRRSYTLPPPFTWLSSCRNAFYQLSTESDIALLHLLISYPSMHS